MGCDGGSIPKRHEVIKNKQASEGRGDRSEELASKWEFCALSGMRLREPVVACRLGRLYNKEAVLEHILALHSARSAAKANMNKKPASSSPSGSRPPPQAVPSTSSASASREHQSSSSAQPLAPNSIVAHIRSLKDVTELKLKTENLQFVCPIIGLEMSGRYRFCYFRGCGCVISERALKKVPNDDRCLVCSQQYVSRNDVTIINGTDEEVKALKDALDRQREIELEAKRFNRSHRKRDKYDGLKISTHSIF